MLMVTMPDCTILEIYKGTSQKGNSYTRIKFLDSDLDVYEIYTSADVDSQLIAKNRYDLDFEVSPAYRGGVRFDLSSFVPLDV